MCGTFDIPIVFRLDHFRLVILYRFCDLLFLTLAACVCGSNHSSYVCDRAISSSERLNLQSAALPVLPFIVLRVCRMLNIAFAPLSTPVEGPCPSLLSTIEASTVLALFVREPAGFVFRSENVLPHTPTVSHSLPWHSYHLASAAASQAKTLRGRSYTAAVLQVRAHVCGRACVCVTCSCIAACAVFFCVRACGMWGDAEPSRLLNRGIQSVFELLDYVMQLFH